jgi:hypothetical protein
LTIRDRPTPPTNLPDVSPKREFNPTEAGFSLLADEETLSEIESIHDETVKHARETLKFAWR